MDFVFWLSLIVFCVSAVVFTDVALGIRKMRRLHDTAPLLGNKLPTVSVIVPALNEAHTIEPALQSLLALDYPGLEVIAVNDRSSDDTPKILERMANQHAHLRVLHIAQLPPGWLGKNHALHQGAQLARGDYLLFTDADVVYETTALRRAIAYCEQHCIDHLTLMPDVVAKTLLLAMLILSFSVHFLARFRPWKVRSSSRHYVGAGAFNLVRRSSYLHAGGHAAIPLAVLDDVMLGKLIKASGGRQDALFAQGLVAIEWYRNTIELANGMKKNIFAAFDYRLSKLVAVTALMLLMRLFPWAGLFITDSAARAFNLLTVFMQLGLYVEMLRAGRWSYLCLMYAPVVSIVELCIWWRASLWAFVRGGIEWRGTRYSLKELKRAHQQ